MEKKMILVGLSRRDMVKDFFDTVLSSLKRASVHITRVEYHRYRFSTDHTETLFVFPSDHVHMLDGIMADAIFGSQYDPLLHRAKPDAVISHRDGIGLVDYIVKVEREACKPKVWITTAGTDTRELYNCFLNSVYGAFPEDRRPFVALDTDTAPKVEFIRGRGSGKTQACIDYMKQLIEKGLISMNAENAYIRNDVMTAKQLNEIMIQCGYRAPWTSNMPEIKNVHFSGPVTAVIWMDGTKTIVRCQGDSVQDPEKGLAMAIAKKALGTNKSGSNYYDIFKQFLPKEEQDG